VTLAATDTGGSGVAHIYYTINGGGTLTYTAPFTVNTAGSTTITYWSVDVAGNTEANPANVGYVNIDKTAPTTAATWVPAANGDGWNKSAVTVTLTGTDTAPPLAVGSGVLHTYYVIDPVDPLPSKVAPYTGWTLYSAPFAVSDEGQHVIKYWSVDTVGNIATTSTSDVNIDLAPPVTQATYAAPNITLIARDPLLADGNTGSGVFHTYYKINGAASYTPYTVPFAVNPTDVVTFYAADVAGNVESAKMVDCAVADTVAPLTTDDAPVGWENIPVTVTLTPTDPSGAGPSSGVAGTYHVTDTSPLPPQVAPYTDWISGTSITIPAPGGFTHANDGVHTITYWSADNAGNLEVPHACTVNIDTQRPTTTSAGPWTNGTSTLTATDQVGLSGVASITYKIDFGTEQTVINPSPSLVFATDVAVPGATGGHTLTWYATDAAGNNSFTESDHVTIDKTAPVTVVTGADALWHNAPVTLTFTATDNTGGSGVDYIQYSTNNGTTWTKGTSNPCSLVVSAEGVTTVMYRSADLAGNVETAKSVDVKISTVGPTTTDNYDGKWHNSDVTIALTATAGASGVDYTEYKVGGGAWTHGATVVVPAAGNEGLTVVDYRSADLAGNVEPTQTVTVKIDMTAPVTVIHGVPAGWVNVAPTVTLTATDNLSSVAKTEYSTDNGTTWTTGTTVPVPATNGILTISFRSTDGAGNVEATQTAQVMLDTVGPVVKSQSKLTIRKHHTGQLHYKVLDNATTALVTIKITKGMTTVKTINVGSVQTGMALTSSIRASFKKGTYKIKVYAMDAVGNAQSKVGKTKLIVK
jgi:hypothetical protein